MTLQEIKEAVNCGKTVHWSNAGYIVTGANDNYIITFISNGSSIGLTWLDGVTLNGKECDFFIA